MPLELEPIAAPAHVERRLAQPPALRGAELVHLAEELYLRMFAIACALVIGGSALALCFATLDRGSPAPTTVAGVAAAVAFAIAGLTRSRELYRVLRSRTALQLAPAALGALVVLIDGPESECWWIALPLLWVVATLSSTPLALAAAGATATAFVGGTLLGGQALAGAGDLGVLPATFALPAYTLVGRVLVDGFAGLVLGRYRRALEPARLAPIRVQAFVSPGPARRPGRAAPATRARGRLRPASRLTARQLEVTLLLRDGLRQVEVAACLGISVRQVERLLAGARERVGATTTTQLVAMLAAGALGASRPE